jgi:hypothetical protein
MIRLGRTTAAKLVILAALALAGCGFKCSPQSQQKAALAAKNASIVVQSFQDAEISSYRAGLVSPEDHLFIQGQVKKAARVGLALDSCIRMATSSAGTVACIDVSVQTIDSINSEGGLGIKSTEARQTFQIAMTGVKAALLVLQDAAREGVTK